MAFDSPLAGEIWNSKYRFRPHEGTGDATVEATWDRVAAALEDVRRVLADSGGGHAVWITHAGVIRALQYLQTHGHRTVAGAHEWPQDAPNPGGWTLLRW